MSFLVLPNVPDRPRIAPAPPRTKLKIGLQKCQESGIQELASQHIFQQRNAITQKPNNETDQTSKASNRSEPKGLKQHVIVKGCSEAAANTKNVAWELASRNQRASKHSNREY